MDKLYQESLFPDGVAFSMYRFFDDVDEREKSTRINYSAYKYKISENFLELLFRTKE